MGCFRHAMCVFSILLLTFTVLIAAISTPQPSIPRPFLKGSIPAEGVNDGSGMLVVHTQAELLGVGRNTPMGYPPPPKINPPYHG